MWGRERLKVEKLVRKWSQNALFCQFSTEIFITEGSFWPRNMQLRALQPFRDHLDLFPSKALEK